MNRLFKALAAFSLAGLIGRHPLWAGTMTLLGVGGVIATNITTPTITPQPSAYFSESNALNRTNNALRPNNGVAGAFETPSSVLNSAMTLGEFRIDANLGTGTGALQYAISHGANTGLAISGRGGSLPQFYLRDAQGTSNWWLSPGNTTANMSASAGSGYNTGLYAATASGGCARQPSVVWAGGSSSVAVTDPGLMCPNAPTLAAASVPGAGGSQAAGTNAGLSAITCATGPVAGEITLTAQVAVAHGVSPGLTYALGGLAAPFATNYVALPGTSGTTLVGEAAINGGTCSGFADNGAATEGAGTSATFTFQAISTTAPWASLMGQTGVTAQIGQKVCLGVVEYGDDSAFPGAQALVGTDTSGAALPGAPALVTWLNQGVAGLNGTTTTSSQVLTVNSLPTTAITSVSYNGGANPNGTVTVVAAAAPGLVAGSEFTISGNSVAAYNRTYVVLNPTNASLATQQAQTTFQANPLTGPAGMLSPLANPGSSGSGGSMASVLMPGMTVLGVTTAAIIGPYGQNGTNGAGQTTGFPLTYSLTASQASGVTAANLGAYEGFYMTGSTSGSAPFVTVTAKTQATLGDSVNIFGSSLITNVANASGWGGSIANVMRGWGVFPQLTTGAPDTTALASVCKKTTDFQTFAAANGIAVNSLYRLNDPGLWADSSVAQFTASITGASGSTATLSPSATQTGALTGSGTATIAGFGVPGCPSACPTISRGAGPTYTLTWGSAIAANVASEPMTAGNFVPAISIATNGFNGYVDAPGGVPTLHVTSTATSAVAKFTGSLAGTGLTTSGASGAAIVQGMLVTDGTGTCPAGGCLTGAPLLINGGSGSAWTVVANYYPTITSDTAMVGTLTSLFPGEYVLSSLISTPVKIVAYGANTPALCADGTLNCGTYILSTSANGTIGSSGSPVAFTAPSVLDGGAIAPGPALTITDLGPGVEFPVTNFGAGTGKLTLSGSYNAPTLGGTPSGIQALVSASANGPALSGCTPCNWGSLAATISGGAWSGTIAGIPAGGPYWVSVRATNGTAYATLPSYVKVGLVIDAWGEGILQSLFGPGNISPAAVSNFVGFWGVSNWNPDTATNLFSLNTTAIGNFTPSGIIMTAGDPLSVTSAGTSASIPEGVQNFEQSLTSAFGWPVHLNAAIRDGIGIVPETLGNSAQTQTVGVGDGTKTVWCSDSKFCANTNSEALTFNAASLTGAQFTGSTSGSTLTVGATISGALMPGLTLAGAGVTGSPTLVNCLTGCSGVNASSTWGLSASLGTIGSETMTAQPASGTPWPFFNIQGNGLPFLATSNGFGYQLVKPSTFSISVNGTTVCQDTQAFAYGNTGGNCAGAGIASSFVNYQTGDYEIAFSTPPANNAVITAAWTNIISPGAAPSVATISRPPGFDFFDGPLAALSSKTPGGFNGHIFGSCNLDAGFFQSNYNIGAPGFTQEVSWLYGTRWPATIPGATGNEPFISADNWRGEGSLVAATQFLQAGTCDEWGIDVATQSTFSGTISSNVLTLTSAATGPMWEGEVIGSSTSVVTWGAYILDLKSGTWGAVGSTYDLGGSPANVASATAMKNEIYYKGAGPAIYAAPLYDISMLAPANLAATLGFGLHPGAGPFGVRRAADRLAALTWGGLTVAANASDPTLDRVKAHASGCDASATAAPCFDIGNTFAATATPIAVSGAVLTLNGLSAGARPIVAGQAVSCTGCSGGLFVKSVSNPPTQSTVAGQGQIGSANNGWTVTLNAAPGASGVPFTFGCSGTSGSGSNCIDFAIQQNTTNGTFGTAWGLMTCGVNVLNGTVPNYTIPNGFCTGSGVGSLVRSFRIGTQQAMYATGATGSPYDDGVDPFNNYSVNQSAAFSCNVVSATVVQCVKGPAYSGGVLTGIGQWSTGSTFASYGNTVASGRIAQLLGYVGGQSFPFTPGSGYTNGVYTITPTGCGVSGGGVTPRFDVTVAGTAIADVQITAATSGGIAVGSGVGTSCTIPLTALGGGSGGAIPNITLAPIEGAGGISTYNTDTNEMGTFMYGNEGVVGNPLNSFFTNGQGGFWEPGLPVKSFGMFMGAAVGG